MGARFRLPTTGRSRRSTRDSARAPGLTRSSDRCGGSLKRGTAVADARVMDAHLCPYDERLKPFGPPKAKAEKTAVFATVKKFFDSWRGRAQHDF